MKCAFYEQDITPPLYRSMPGYYKERPAAGVLDKLYLKTFLAENDGKITGIIEFDCVELATEYYTAIIDGIRERGDVDANGIAVCATHSHTGIPCGGGGGLDGESDDVYMKNTVRLAIDSVTLAKQRLTDAELSFGTGNVTGIAFNRNYVMADGNVKTNPGKWLSEIEHPYAENDPLLPIMFVKDKNGTPIGALISYACHQDCVGKTEYSGDFSSEMSLRLKEKYGNGFVSLFMEGAAGDINHLDYMSQKKGIKPDDGGIPHYRMMGRKLASEVIRVIENGLVPVTEESIGYGTEILEIPYRKVTQADVEKQRLTSEGAAFRMEKYIEMDLPDTHTTPVQVLKVGNTFIFALPGEIYHQYATKIRNEFPKNNVLVATLSAGSHGYMPIAEIMDEDIYEARTCIGSCLEREAGNKVTASAIKTAKSL